MALLDAKCTNCGGVLKIEAEKEAAVCSYCGSAFVVQKAVQNFNTVNNIYAQNVNVQNVGKDYQIEAGRLIKYTGASKEIVIPPDVDIVAARCFMGMGITSVSMGDNVKKIEMAAFYDCKNLINVKLSNSIEEIPASCFFGCVSLIDINTPSSLKKIGRGAFNGCSLLRDFQFLESIQIENAAFGNTKIDTIKYPIIVNSEANENEVFAERNNLRTIHGCDSGRTVYYKDRVIVDEAVAVQYIEDLKKIFFNTPFECNLELLAKDLRNERIKKNVCSYCGGEFKGLFTKVCSSCQRSKDY